MNKILIQIIFISLISLPLQAATRYEPAVGKSGAVMDAGTIRFPIAYQYGEAEEFTHSRFNFGLDFGLGQSTELQSRIDYHKNEGADFEDTAEFEWVNWTELLKFRISEKETGPAYCLGAGLRIPVRKIESLGLVTGLFISSAIKDIDFDFNLGFNPFFTYADLGDGIKIRPNHYINVDLLLGYRLLPFLKINGGFESRQLLKGSQKIETTNADGEKEVSKSDIDGGSIWDFVIGCRLKPIDYPIAFDTGIYFRAGDEKGVLPLDQYDWKFKLGIQIIPEGAEAEW